eukprot:Clim_evm33s7 gene=Clim_evmTU33s7
MPGLQDTCGEPPMTERRSKRLRMTKPVSYSDHFDIDDDEDAHTLEEPVQKPKRRNLKKEITVKEEPTSGGVDYHKPPVSRHRPKLSHRNKAILGRTLHVFHNDEVPDFQENLLAWYLKVRRTLPWRTDVPKKIWTTRDYDRQPAVQQRAYEIWVSEIMLQQTQVVTVVGYFKRWMAAFPTLKALADADLDTVLKNWAGLGYYSRARNLHKGARYVVYESEELRGFLPSTAEELQRHLPGVGAYTAGAIASIGFGRAVPIVDGNVIRVVCRQRAIGADTATKPTLDFIWAQARALVVGLGREDDDRVGDFNQALMELGATVCTPQNAKCGQCPVRESCLANAETVEFKQNRFSALFTNGRGKGCMGTVKGEQEDIEECDLCLPLEVLADVQWQQGPEQSNTQKNTKDKRRTRKREKHSEEEPLQINPRFVDTSTFFTPTVEVYPRKRKAKPPIEQRHYAFILVNRDGRVLMRRARAPHEPGSKKKTGGLLHGLWEFPLVTAAEDDDGGDKAMQGHMVRFLQEIADQKDSKALPPGLKSLPKSSTLLTPVSHRFSHIKQTYVPVLVGYSRKVTRKKSSAFSSRPEDPAESLLEHVPGYTTFRKLSPTSSTNWTHGEYEYGLMPERVDHEWHKILPMAMQKVWNELLRTQGQVLQFQD